MMEWEKFFTDENGVMWLFGTIHHNHFSFKFSVLWSDFTVHVLYGIGSLVSDNYRTYGDKDKICGMKIVVLENAVFHNYVFHVRYDSDDIHKYLELLDEKIHRWMQMSHSHVCCKKLVEKVVKNVVLGINTNLRLI